MIDLIFFSYSPVVDGITVEGMLPGHLQPEIQCWWWGQWSVAEQIQQSYHLDIDTTTWDSQSTSLISINNKKRNVHQSFLTNARNSNRKHLLLYRLLSSSTSLIQKYLNILFLLQIQTKKSILISLL